MQNLDPEITGRTISVKTQMKTFDYFYGATVLQLLLRRSNNLARMLQSPSIAVCKEKNTIATLSTKTWHSLRPHINPCSLWDKILMDAKIHNVNEQSLPRKLKRPARLLNEE